MTTHRQRRAHSCIGPRQLATIAALIAILVGGLGGRVHVGSAQDAADTPILYYATEPVPPEECVVEPIDAAVVREAAARVYARPVDQSRETPSATIPSVGIAAFYLPTSVSGFMVYVDGEVLIDDGRPVGGIPAQPGLHVDPATLEAITTTLRLRAACLNAGATLEGLNFYTVRYIEELIEGARREEGADQSVYDNVSGSRAPREPEFQRLEPVVSAVRLSSDGTAVVYGLFSLTVSKIEPTTHGRQLDVIKMVLTDDGWRIDDDLGETRDVVIAPESLRPEATPAASPPVTVVVATSAATPVPSTPAVGDAPTQVTPAATP